MPDEIKPEVLPPPEPTGIVPFLRTAKQKRAAKIVLSASVLIALLLFAIQEFFQGRGMGILTTRVFLVIAWSCGAVLVFGALRVFEFKRWILVGFIGAFALGVCAIVMDRVYPMAASSITLPATTATTPFPADNDIASTDTSSLDSDSQYGILDLSPQDKKKIESLKDALFRFKAQTIDTTDYYKFQIATDRFRKETEALEAQRHCLLAMPECRCLPKPPTNTPTGNIDIDISAKIVAPQMSESRFWVIHKQTFKLRVPIAIFVSLVSHEKTLFKVSQLYLEAKDVGGWADARMADSWFPSWGQTLDQKPLVFEAKNASVSMKGEYLLPFLYDRVIQPGDHIEGWIIAEYPKGFKYGSSIGEMRISLLAGDHWIASKVFNANPPVYAQSSFDGHPSFYFVPLDTLITERP